MAYYVQSRCALAQQASRSGDIPSCAGSWALVLLLAIASSTCGAERAMSFVRNGAFEADANWTLQNAALVAEGHPGRCLRIAGPGGAAQDFRAPTPGSTWTTAVDVKTANVRPVAGQSGFAFAAVYQLDRQGGLLTFRDFIQARGTADWQRQHFTFQVHPQAETISLRCGLHQAEGTVWLDNWTVVAGAEPRTLAEADEHGSRGVRTRDAAAILDEPGLPKSGAPSQPATIATILRAAGLDTTLLSAESLADPAHLNRARFDLVVIPTGAAFPALARIALTDFLRDGGDLMTLGGYACDQLVRQVDGRWRAEDEYVAAEIETRLASDRGLLPDGGFELSPQPPSQPAAVGQWQLPVPLCTVVQEQPHSGRRCVQVAIPQGSPTLGAQVRAELPARAGSLYRIHAWLRSQAVAGTGFAYAAVYQHDAAGKLVTFRDFAIARGTEPWRKHEYTFTAQPGVTRLHVLFGMYQAQGTAWFDDFQLAEITGLSYEPLNTARGEPEDGLVVSPVQLGMFDPSVPLKRVQRLKTAAGQSVSQLALDEVCPVTGWAATGVTGVDQARWIPLLEARDVYQRPRGAAAALLLHYGGHYAGSCWMYCGVDNRDLFREPSGPFARVLQDAARFMIRKTYLRNLKTTHRLYQPGESVQASVAVDNRGPRAQTVEVRLSWPAGRDAASRTVQLAPGQSRVVSADLKLPADAADLCRLQAVALLDGRPLDQLESGVVVARPAAARQGVKLRFRDNYFTLNGRPQFLFGSDDYAITYHAAADNPATWTQMLGAARDAGLDLYENLQYHGPAFTLRDEDWRDFHAMNHMVQQHKLVFMPGMLIGEDAAATPQDLARQSALCRQYAAHLADTPGLLYYLNGDYSLLREPTSPDVRRMWNDWLRTKYATTEKLRAAWTGVAAVGELGEVPFPPPNSGRWDDGAAIDTGAFRQWLVQRWNAAHVAAVREVDQQHPLTSEYYQRPLGGIDLRSTIDPQDVSNVGFFDRPQEDLDTLPIVLRWNDRRIRGQGVSLGEYGVKTHPAWQESRGGTGYHIARTEEQQQQLFLSVGCYALGLGACKVQNWCLRDDSTRVFPWGLFYPNGCVPKDVAYTHRNLSLAWRQFEPVYEPPAATVCLAGGLRKGNADELGLTIGGRAIADLLALHYNFNTIDDDDLARLPPATRVLVLPTPMSLADRGYAPLKAWVAAGGTLLVTGDFSYDERRRRTHTDRLEELAGVRFVAELFPNVARTQAADVRSDLSSLGLGKPLLRPGLRVQPTTAKVLGQTADGVPVLVQNRLGQGQVFYLTDPLELADDEAAAAVRRGLYAAVLGAGGLKPLPVEPAAPWLHAMTQATRQGTVYVVFNTRQGPGGAEVTLTTPAGPIAFTVRNGWPALAAVSKSGHVLAVLTDGAARVADRPVVSGKGLKLVLTLDGSDLRDSPARLVAPFESGTCTLPLPVGELAATVGEFQDGVWKSFEQLPLRPADAAFEINPDRATCLIIVGPPADVPRFAQQLWAPGG